MRFYFIRHGQSENNLLWDETGSSKGRSEDPELTKAGHQQAVHLASYIRAKDQTNDLGGINDVTRDTFQFTHLYTSLMVRAVRTAYALSESLQVPLQAWPETHECGGIYLDDADGKQVGLPGKPRSFFTSNFQKMSLPDTVNETGWYNRPFEQREERAGRAKSVIETLLAKHGDTEDSVALVSHGAFYVEMIRHLLGIENDQCWFMMHNTAVSRFDLSTDGYISLIYHNRTDHLPLQLIT